MNASFQSKLTAYRDIRFIHSVFSILDISYNLKADLWLNMAVQHGNIKNSFLLYYEKVQTKHINDVLW